jgi:hypothetical protein
MTVVFNILLHTPWWAFVLFALLLGFGLQALKPRTIPISRLLIVPAVFIGWGAASLAPRLTQSSPLLVADWLFAALAGAALLWLTGRPDRFGFERAGFVSIAGSALPLARNMAIFFARYALVAAATINPAQRPSLAVWDLAVSGASTGYFVAWLALLAVAYQRATRDARFAPQDRASNDPVELGDA